MGTLTPTCPTSTSRSNLRAVAPELVKIAVPLPYLFSLMIASASSRVSALMTTSTGPKISSLCVARSASGCNGQKMLVTGSSALWS